MVRDPPRPRRDVTDRRAGRGRLFLGSAMLLGAVVACVTGLFVDPVDDSAIRGDERVRIAVVILMRNSAIATLVLVLFACLLLFPRPRLRNQLRDGLFVAVATVLAAISVYRLVWLQVAVTG